VRHANLGWPDVASTLWPGVEVSDFRHAGGDGVELHGGFSWRQGWGFAV